MLRPTIGPMPKIYDRRFYSIRLPDGTTYWGLEIYQTCACPDCEADGHWFHEAGTHLATQVRLWEERGAEAVALSDVDQPS